MGRLQVMQIKESGTKHVYYLYNSQDFKTGWYFSDECEQSNGPFATEEAAVKAFTLYCEHL